jgi:hypothetical protein
MENSNLSSLNLGLNECKTNCLPSGKGRKKRLAIQSMNCNKIASTA